MDKTSFELVKNVLVIHVNGDLDHHSSVEIRKIADEKIYENMVKNIVFDFEKTEFMDSSGVGVIMGRYKMVRSLGGQIIGVNIKRNVDKILTFSGLNKLVTRCGSLEEALEQLEVK